MSDPVLPRDEFEWYARWWASSEEALRLAAEAERRYGLDPMLLDRLSDALHRHAAGLSDSGEEANLALMEVAIAVLKARLGKD